jgi:hypothetical protein
VVGAPLRKEIDRRQGKDKRQSIKNARMSGAPLRKEIDRRQGKDIRQSIKNVRMAGAPLRKELIEDKAEHKKALRLRRNVITG